MQDIEFLEIYNNLIDYVSSNVWAQIGVLLIAGLVVTKVIHATIDKVVRGAVRSHRYKSKLEERQREQTLTSIFRPLATIVVWVFVVFWALAMLNVDIAALFTGAGLIGIVVGFGAQNTIKDILAGIFVILENQYRVGDIITVAGVSGVVEGITVRITKLRDLDGILHFVPNGEVTVVSNRTFSYANVNVDVGVAYESDLEKVRNVINRVGVELAKDKSWKDMIVEPIQFLRVDEFADSAIIIKVLGRVIPPNQWDVAGEFRLRLKTAFDEEGITIPFPQRVIHQAK